MYPNQSSQKLIIPLVIISTLGIGLAVSTVWFFAQYNEQKTKVDEKIAVAVEEAKALQATELAVEYDERNKNPLVSYVSNEQTGSVSIKYPRTWSGYLDENTGSNARLSAYFFPGIVPAINNRDINFALRIVVETREYASVVKTYQRSIDDGDATAKGLSISGVNGVRIDGMIDREKQGAIIIMPLRDKTIKIWTESPDYLSDFNTVIVPNFSFKP